MRQSVLARRHAARGDRMLAGRHLSLRRPGSTSTASLPRPPQRAPAPAHARPRRVRVCSPVSVLRLPWSGHRERTLRDPGRQGSGHAHDDRSQRLRAAGSAAKSANETKPGLGDRLSAGAPVPVARLGMGRRPRTLTPEASARDHFGAELRRWRTARRLTQRALARLIWHSQEFVAKVEKGERWPSWDLATRCDVALRTGGVLAGLWPGVER